MKMTETEKIHGPIIKMLSFCHECSSVKVRHRDDKVFWQGSIVVFDHLPKEKCLVCIEK